MGKSFGQKLKNIGPAAIITSAFVGPGTITTCTLAGVNFGYTLLWTVVFSGISLIILMEMAARTALASGMNVIDASIAMYPENKAWEKFVQIVVFLAVLAVCFAFQAGNEIGASSGLGDIFGMPQWLSALIVGVIALVAGVLGSYKFLEKVMQFFVSAMGVLFVITMVTVRPDVIGILKGIIPVLPAGSGVTSIALIGTTLVGINLILHSITCQDRFHGIEDLDDARFDINVNVLIGVVITMAIIITSTAVLYGTDTQVSSPLVFSKQLEPVLGSWARVVGDLGLFSAGMSSAIAVAYTIKAIYSKLFHWKDGSNCFNAKAAGTLVVAFGTALAMVNTKPAQIIVFAQATSGFSLPFIAILLMMVTNNKKIMGEHVNSTPRNIWGVTAVVVTLGIGLWGLYGFARNFI